MVSIWKYARDDLNNFLVFYLPYESELNEFELKMSSNLQTYFLPPIYDEKCDLILEEDCALTKRLDHGAKSNVEIMNRRVIKYKISNTVMLSKYLSGNDTQPEDVFRIMEQILDIYYISIDYLLVPSQILFDLDKIFFDFRTQRVYMVYIPINEYRGINDFKEFIISYFNLFLDKKTQASRSFDYYESIIRYCQKDSFCMDGFKNILLYYKKELFRIKSEKNNVREFDYGKFDRRMKYHSEISSKYSRFIEKPDDHSYIEQERKPPKYYDYDEEESPSLSYEENPHEVDAEQYALKRRSKKLKNILIKTIGLYFFLIILFLLFINNSNRLFGDSSEIRTFIGILFFFVSIYCYIRFLHEDTIGIIHDWREEKKKNKLKIKVDDEGYKKKIKEIQNKREVSQRIYENEQPEKLYEREMGSYLMNFDTGKKNAFFRDETRQKNMYFETELLESHQCNYLINILTGEKVYIDKNVFKIGRHEQENDFIVEDRSIGRFHIQLDTSEKGVEITDLGSKNGTFINNNRIFPYTKSVLNKGDIVRLAGTSFSFNS